jgi:hypothetical protein
VDQVVLELAALDVNQILTATIITMLAVVVEQLFKLALLGPVTAVLAAAVVVEMLVAHPLTETAAVALAMLDKLEAEDRAPDLTAVLVGQILAAVVVDQERGNLLLETADQEL